MFSINKDTTKIVLLQHNDRDVEDLIEESPHTIIQIDHKDRENSRPKWKKSCFDIKLLIVIVSTFLAVTTLFFIITHFLSSHKIESISSEPLATEYSELLDSNDIPKNKTQVCDTPNCIQSAANLLQSMDLNVDPCDNFYQYTCGNWPKHHTRPDLSDIWGWNKGMPWGWHTVLQSQVNKGIQIFFESTPKSDEPAVISQSRVMYESCMNADKQAEYGKKLVEEYLLEKFGLPDFLSMIIKGTSFSVDNFDWITTIAKVKKTLDIDIIFKFDIKPHPTNVAQKEFRFDKPTNENVTSEKIKNYIDFLHPYSNDEVVEQLSEKILKIDENFTTMLIKKIQGPKNVIANKLKGRHYARRFVETILNQPSTNIQNRLIIWDPEYSKYYEDVKNFISKVNKTDLALYIWWKIVNELVTLIEEQYEVSEHQSAKCAEEVVDYMGIIMSYAIAQPNFQNTTELNVQQMMNRIRSSFQDLVGKSDWINNESKEQILEKSQAMKMNLGSPNWIFNNTQINAYFGDIEFNENSYLENIIKIRSLKLNRKLKSLTSTDNTEWGMLPIQVNANYDPKTNTMTIPQAILQFPFHDMGLESLNFGATDLGHEFMHAFDSEGIEFDKNGNWHKNNWSGIREEYNKRTQSLIDQYSKFYMPDINDHINGEKTLNENIADNVGLLLAYNAYKKLVKEQGEEKMLLPGFEGFTKEQLFFIAYGNKWCNSITPEISKAMLAEDPHSPNEFRVNGVVANMKEFQHAFKCSTESKMVSKNVCQIW